jgi:NADPH-dependent curcumin reductase CurA
MKALTAGREVHLAEYPKGTITKDIFEINDVAIEAPLDGQVVVRNTYISLDAGMRLRMKASGSPMEHYTLHTPLYGDAMGEVIESRSDNLQVGDMVRHSLGWREYAVADATQFRKIDPTIYPTPSTHLSLGLTAYVGMIDIGHITAGDTVFVSNAASSVGSLAGQIAHIKGASRVIGSVGSNEKISYLVNEANFDKAFNYRKGDIIAQLRSAAPDGIDLYFDNVGGEQLEAALEAMNPGGRIVLCGIAIPEGGSLPAPIGNLHLAISKQLTLQGFNVLSHLNRGPAFSIDYSTWLREGKISYKESVIDGLDQAPEAFVNLLGGQYLGKVVVKL